MIYMQLTELTHGSLKTIFQQQRAMMAVRLVIMTEANYQQSKRPNYDYQTQLF